jgi:dynein heavy chain, axonemal
LNIYRSYGTVFLFVAQLPSEPLIGQRLVQNPVLVETVQKLTEKWLDALTEHKRLNCKELVPCDRLSAIRTVTRYFDSFATPENACDPADASSYPTMLENWFLFCLIWGIGGSLDDPGRKAFDSFFREADPRIPTGGTVFDYWLDPAQKAWVPWETKLPSTFRPPPGTPFFKILVPTVDTHRNRVLGMALLKQNYHVLFTGNVGVGKTMIASAMLDSLPGGRASMVINFSAQTSSNSLQVSRCTLPPVC